MEIFRHVSLPSVSVAVIGHHLQNASLSLTGVCIVTALDGKKFRLSLSQTNDRWPHIGWEPGPGLRMFSAKFFHYHFLLTYTVGHRKFVMTTPNSGPFALRGQKNLFGPTIRYIQILCHCGVRNRHRNTTFGRKHLYIVG